MCCDHPTAVLLWFDGGVDDTPVEIELVEIELVDVSSSGVRAAVPATTRNRRARVAAAVAAAVVVFGAGVVVGRSGDERPAPSVGADADEPPPTGTVTVTIAPVPTARAARPSLGDLTATTRGPNTTVVDRRQVREVGRPLLPVQTGLQLVGLTVDGDVVEIHLDTGRVITTVLPEFDSFDVGTGNGYLVVGDTTAIVGARQRGSALMLVEGVDEPALAPVAVTDASGYALPGPRPDTFWTVLRDPGPRDVDTTLVLVEAVTGDATTVELAQGTAGTWWDVGPDHRGGLVVVSPSGVYTVDEEGPARLSTGQLLATGRRHAIAHECDDRLVCATVLIDRDTGARSEVPAAALGVGMWDRQIESISPDGSALVMLRDSGVGPLEIVLVDVRNGSSTVLIEQYTGEHSLGWSADGRFVLYLDEGRLFYVDRPLGTYRAVSDALPELIAFALRP